MTNKWVDEWELHDIGRTLCSPIEGLYEAVEQFAHKLYSSTRADELIQSSRLREERGTTPQQDFSDFCNIWVKTIEGGDFQLKPKASQAGLVIPGTVVYKDAAEYLARVKKKGVKIGVLTSGTEAFNVHMLNAALPSPVAIDGVIIKNLADLVDKQFRGEEYGDKDKPESINRVYAAVGEENGYVSIVFDDKISVCKAVMKAEGLFDRVVLVDRKGDYKNIAEINNPFECYHSSCYFVEDPHQEHEDMPTGKGHTTEAFDKLSDSGKRVVKLHEHNLEHWEFPAFEVVRNYREFLERQLKHMERYARRE
ncbi:hypothetical protein HY636_02475 [Candidatus Woesearchaeota archaeon]|nr:hypothetical protein [Candidatus Woesearchaeota archaeon]